MKATKQNVNIAQIMIPKVSTAFLHENDTVRQGMEVFRRYGYTAVPVVNSEEKYVGCVSEGDFLRFILSAGTVDENVQEKHRIREIFRPDFCAPLPILADLQDLVKVALAQNFVPIIDDRGCLCGIVTRRALMLYLAHSFDPVGIEKP